MNPVKNPGIKSKSMRINRPEYSSLFLKGVNPEKVNIAEINSNGKKIVKKRALSHPI